MPLEALCELVSQRIRNSRRWQMLALAFKTQRTQGRQLDLYLHRTDWFAPLKARPIPVNDGELLNHTTCLGDCHQPSTRNKKCLCRALSQHFSRLLAHWFPRGHLKRESEATNTERLPHRCGYPDEGWWHLAQREVVMESRMGLRSALSDLSDGLGMR